MYWWLTKREYVIQCLTEYGWNFPFPPHCGGYVGACVCTRMCVLHTNLPRIHSHFLKNNSIHVALDLFSCFPWHFEFDLGLCILLLFLSFKESIQGYWYSEYNFSHTPLVLICSVFTLSLLLFSKQHWIAI